MTEEHANLDALRARVAAAFVDPALPFHVDGVAKALKVDRDTVNELAPWDRAELDASNSTAYEVWLEGDDVEWDFREGPDYYDEDGNRRDGKAAPRLVKPHRVRIHLRARSEDEAAAAALATHPGLHTVASVEILDDDEE